MSWPTHMSPMPQIKYGREQFSQHSSRVLVAKYIPDMCRWEPLNYGVFVWIPGHLVAKFLRMPKFARYPNIYKQWKRHWQNVVRELSESEDVNSVECLVRLSEESAEQWPVVDAGFFWDDVTPENINDAAKKMFNELVA